MTTALLPGSSLSPDAPVFRAQVSIDYTLSAPLSWISFYYTDEYVITRNAYGRAASDPTRGTATLQVDPASWYSGKYTLTQVATQAGGSYFINYYPNVTVRTYP